LASDPRSELIDLKRPLPKGVGRFFWHEIGSDTTSSSENMESKLNNRALALQKRIKQNAVELVSINFALGDLHNEFANSFNISGIDAGKKLAPLCGVARRALETNGRIAKRIPSGKRPKNLCWGAIKYFAADLNPSNIGISEIEFLKVLPLAICEADSFGYSLAKLREKASNSTFGAQIICSLISNK
jgi:hypothetical protein